MEQIACVPADVSCFPCCTQKSKALSCPIRYLLGTNVNKLFFQVPTLEFGHGPGARGTKVGTGSLCAHRIC